MNKIYIVTTSKGNVSISIPSHYDPENICVAEMPENKWEQRLCMGTRDNGMHREVDKNDPLSVYHHEFVPLKKPSDTNTLRKMWG